MGRRGMKREERKEGENANEEGEEDEEGGEVLEGARGARLGCSLGLLTSRLHSPSEFILIPNLAPPSVKKRTVAKA